MTRLSHLFTDRLVNLSVTGSLVRIEMGALLLPENKDQAPEFEPTQALVMPLDVFVNSFGMMDALMKKLVEDGVLKPRAANAPTSNSRPSLRRE